MAEPNDMTSLAGREVLLCVTGGIAAYKAADLTSTLAAAGANVHVAMTEAATKFVAPLTFQALSRNQVFTSMWQATERFDSGHIALTDRAEILIVAPATADILGKMASGIADDLVSALLLTATGACKILVAPAMNSRMWAAPAVQTNVETLKGWAISLVGPAEGRLACGTTGPGRMAEPADILAAAADLLDETP